MSLLKEALKYESRGWSIIPLSGEPNADGVLFPLVKWSMYQSIRATSDQIIDWWTRWPDANIAVITGKISGLVVVDVDPRHGGDSSFIIDNAPTNMVSFTGRGGNHFFYEYPENAIHVPCRVGLYEGIDIRADGGYVVAPPSIHANGNPYTWQTNGKAQKLPPDLLEAILVSDGAEGGKDGQDNSEPWVTEMLDKGVPMGGRNDSLTRLTGYFAKIDMPRDIATSLLTIWNITKNKVPIEQNELLTTVKSVYRTKNRKIDRNRTMDDAAVQQGKEEDLLGFRSVLEFIAEFENHKTSWDIEDWLPQATIGFMVAPPGSYKTWLMVDLAISIASGMPFLGQYPVKNTGPVLFIQQEDPVGPLSKRLAHVWNHKFNSYAKIENDSISFNLPPDLPLYIHEKRQLRFDDTAIMDMLEYRISTLKPKIVFIDPLYSAASTEEYMAKAAEQMLRLKTLRDKYGCSFMILHHTAKKGKTKDGTAPEVTTEREDIWGSQFLNALLETGWQIRSVNNKDKIVVRRHFKDSENKDPLFLQWYVRTKDDDNMYMVKEYEPDDSVKVGETSQVLEALKTGHFRVKDIVSYTGFSRSKVNRELKTLMDSDLVEHTDDGEYILSNT